MKGLRFCVALSVAVLSIVAATPALGLANRVFVSARSGNDANSCNNILTPCQTFAGAVAQLNPDGEAIVLDSGGYGTVTITQSVIIEAPPGVVAFIHPNSGNDAITVTAPGATVVLRGLTIDGAGATTGNGINVVAVTILHVENCAISGFANGGGAGGDGIYFGSPGQLFVKDTIIRGNGAFGIDVVPPSGTAKASVDHCRLERNQWGFVSDGSGGTAKATIRDSVASGNSSSGLLAQNGELNAEGCLVANNGIGLYSFGLGGILRASNCTVTDNSTGLFTTGGGSLLSRSNNTVQGNTTKGSFTGTYLAD